MIRINEENQLVLTPRAFDKESEKTIYIDLERAYLCPLCETLAYGVFETDRGPDRMLNLNPFALASEHTAVKPQYGNRHLVIGKKQYQFFWDENHYGEGTLFDRVKHAVANRCKMVKLYFEPSIPRLYNRFLKDLAKMELYGSHIAGKYRRDHEEILKAVRTALGEDPEKIQLFLAHHPYGRFAPEVTGRGPAAYLAMYRHEHRLLHDFYAKVIEKTHERIYENQNQPV